MATHRFRTAGLDNFQLPESLYVDGSKNYRGGSIHHVGGLANANHHANQESIDDAPDNESGDHSDFDDSLSDYQSDSTESNISSWDNEADIDSDIKNQDLIDDEDWIEGLMELPMPWTAARCFCLLRKVIGFVERLKRWRRDELATINEGSRNHDDKVELRTEDALKSVPKVGNQRVNVHGGDTWAHIIRTNQVLKLPQLTELQKRHHQRRIKHLWDSLDTTSAGDPRFKQAYAELKTISNQMISGMKVWTQCRQFVGQQTELRPVSKPCEVAEDLLDICGVRCRIVLEFLVKTSDPGVRRAHDRGKVDDVFVARRGTWPLLDNCLRSLGREVVREKTLHGE
jgi:hypothetical protein